MDKAFWKTLMQNDYVVPDGHSLEGLTTELFSYLENTDPELRDDIGYIVYANWLKMGLYSQVDIENHITELLANLEKSIGDTDTDSVFLRTFSVLFLAEIVHNDNKAPALDKSIIDEIIEKGLWYLAAEQDPRGYIPVKGWAHALAHTADLMLLLAKNELTDASQHIRILNEISKKLMNASDWVYVHGEDDRLSAAVLAIFQRGLLKTETVQEWLSSFTGVWKGAWTDEERTRAFFNVRNFLRSLHLQVIAETDLSNQDKLEKMLLNTTQELKPY